MNQPARVPFGSLCSGNDPLAEVRNGSKVGGAAAVESSDGFPYYAKESVSPSSIWRVPANGGAEVHVVDGLSYSINFAVGDRGLYFVAVSDTDDTRSVDFVDFATGKRSTLVRLDKPFWFGGRCRPMSAPWCFPWSIARAAT